MACSAVVQVVVEWVKVFAVIQWDLLGFIAVEMVVPVAISAMYEASWSPVEVLQAVAVLQAILFPLQLLKIVKKGIGATQSVLDQCVSWSAA